MGLIYFLVCLIPLILGFVIPFGILLNFVLKGFAIINFNAIFSTTLTSISIAAVASILVMLVSIIMVIVSVYKSNNLQKGLIFLSSCGYAFPGTILAVGVVVFVGWLNELIYFHLTGPN